MHSLRKPKKRRIIKIQRNEEQTAQDKLFQISYQADADNFVDQSKILTFQHSADTGRKEVPLHGDIKRLITRSRIGDTQRREGHFSRQSVERGKKGVSVKEDQELIIQNRLESNSVFIGNTPKIRSSVDATNCMFLKPKKRLETCPGLHQMRPVTSTKKAATECSEGLEHLMIGRPTSPLRHTSYSLARSWKIRSKSNQKMNELRLKMRSNLFFSTAQSFLQRINGS